MTVSPVHGRHGFSRSGAGHHSRLSRWAVGLAGGTAAVVAVSYAVFGISYAVGGAGATEDNWVGLLAAVALLGSLAVSFVAFVLAVAAWLRRERWSLLWLPLSVFPALLAITVLAEVFWIE